MYWSRWAITSVYWEPPASAVPGAYPVWAGLMP